MLLVWLIYFLALSVFAWFTIMSETVSKSYILAFFFLKDGEVIPFNSHEFNYMCLAWMMKGKSVLGQVILPTL